MAANNKTTGMHKSEFITQSRTTMYFLGVTTGSSASRLIFPRWAEVLDLGEAQLVGVDLPLDAPLQDYRRWVIQIKFDPLSLGALITSHKINILTAAQDLFDEISPDARLCQEVSCIYKRQGRLIAHAVDPFTCGVVMDQFLGKDYWRERKTDILCLGAGGTATALAVYFLNRVPAHHRPRRLVFVDKLVSRLDRLGDMVKDFPDSGIELEFIHNCDALVNDQLMDELPPGSMVINATGMGKDAPGSPISPMGLFPQDGIAWELNYRGELDFQVQAKAQAEERNLRVVDGWAFFLQGWAAEMSYIFDIEISPSQFERMGEIAESLRSYGDSETTIRIGGSL